MAKTRSQKEELVKSFAEKLTRAKSVVFANFRGLKVKEAVLLRKKCRGEDADYMVAKKTLMNRVFKDADIPVDAAKFQGDVGTIFGYEDEASAARITQEFAKSHEALKAVGGILENIFIDSKKVLELSKLPSRKELLSKLVGSLNSPVSGFARVLAGNLRGLAQVLKAIQKNK